MTSRRSFLAAAAAALASTPLLGGLLGRPGRSRDSTGAAAPSPDPDPAGRAAASAHRELKRYTTRASLAQGGSLP